jgi:hypothetical protein
LYQCKSGHRVPLIITSAIRLKLTQEIDRTDYKT